MPMRVLRVDQNSKLWTLQPKQWTERCWNAQLSWWRTIESANDFLWACQNDSLRLLLLCYFILCYYEILIRAALKYWFAGHYISCTHCAVKSSMHSLPKLRGWGSWGFHGLLWDCTHSTTTSFGGKWVECPQSTLLFPSWDLQVVLSALCLPPLGPLTFGFSAFHSAFASAMSVSELSALSADEVCLRFGDGHRMVLLGLG